VITNPGVLFTCDDETVHMGAGECWLFDSFRWHDVQNQGDAQRIHLVLDTVGGGLLPQMLKAAESPAAPWRLLKAGERSGDGLLFENVNSPEIMSPWEMRCHLAFIREQSGAEPATAAALERVDQFIDEWAAAWAHFGTDPAGRPTYSRLLDRARADLGGMGVQQIEMPNQLQFQQVLEELIFHMAIGAPAEGAGRTNEGARRSTAGTYRERIERPVFILSTPRSGSTLLYETLEQAPGLFSTGDESHWVIEAIRGLAPAQRRWSSNRLTAEDVTFERAEQLAAAFYGSLRDREGRPAAGRVRMLEKTPKNALRVPFFDALWPDSIFIYLYRDVRETLYSMMEAWHSGGFRTYPELPGWQGPPWSLLLVPGWERLNGLQLQQVVARQWAITTDQLIDDLERVGQDRVHAIDYGAFLAAPQAEAERLANAAGLQWDRTLSDTLPLSKTTLSQPRREKWRRMEGVIESVLPIVENADRRARAFVERHAAAPADAA
jgi:hypothetical protein